MSINKFEFSLPLSTLFPKAWKDILGNMNNVAFRNFHHFKHAVSQVTQKQDDYCGITYKEALDNLVSGKAGFPASEQSSIRNLVRSNLLKRGLITEEVYENYRYTVDGTSVGVDVSKFANGEPDCVITPAVQYVDFFHELYISISYSHHVTNETVQKNVAKLLATIEELERQHIFIKIMLVLPIRQVTKSGDTSFFSSIPLFSHKDRKSVETMSSVVNDKLLRKFYFAILEDLYGNELDSGYGRPTELPQAMSIGDEFDEVEFFENVVKNVGA